MRNTNKKGFTIVELVIVVAVIAILAAVLIPTFSGIIRKANISSDTVVAKNLNTAAIAAGADTFEDALAAVREAGYYVANLNAKAVDCYFVWEDDSNQFVLYDLKNSEIIYSNTKVEGAPDASWCFAVSNSTVAAAVKAVLANITIKNTAASVADVNDIIAAGGETTIYIDESVVLEASNILLFENANANTTINLGTAQLNTSGLLDGVVPIQIKAGTVTFEGGVIGGGGAYIDADGQRVNSSLETDEGSTVLIKGTVFNVAASGYVTFKGDATLDSVTIDSENIGVYCGGNGDVVLENVTIDAAGRCVWATNYDGVNHTNKSATITIKSGTYNGGTGSFKDSYAAVTVVAYSGDIVIEGGEFTTGSGILFQVMESNGSITLKGGTFAGKTLSELGKSGIEELCNGTFKVTDNNDGTFTITLK